MAGCPWPRAASTSPHASRASLPISGTQADSSMQDAAALMVSKKFNRLPVVDEVGSIVGILTSTDVMRLVVSGALELN